MISGIQACSRRRIRSCCRPQKLVGSRRADAHSGSSLGSRSRLTGRPSGSVVMHLRSRPADAVACRSALFTLSQRKFPQHPYGRRPGSARRSRHDADSAVIGTNAVPTLRDNLDGDHGRTDHENAYEEEEQDRRRVQDRPTDCHQNAGTDGREHDDKDPSLPPRQTGRGSHLLVCTRADDELAARGFSIQCAAQCAAMRQHPAGGSRSPSDGPQLSSVSRVLIDPCRPRLVGGVLSRDFDHQLGQGAAL